MAPTVVPPAPESAAAAARLPERPAAEATGPAPGAVDLSFDRGAAPAGGVAAAAAPPAAAPVSEAGVVPRAENGPPEARARDEASGEVKASEAVPEWAGSAPSLGLAARLKGTAGRDRRNLLLVAGGVGVLAAVGIAVFAGGGKKRSVPEQMRAPVRSMEKAAASAQAAVAKKPAPPAVVAEPAKPQPAAEAKPTAPAKNQPVAVEQIAAPAEKPAQPEKPALAPTPAAEKKVAAEKPAPAERPVAQKPAAAPKPAVEKPVADRPSNGLAVPRPEKKPAQPATPSAKLASNRAQEAAEAYQRGNAKLLNGAPVEAVLAFSEALRLNPKDAQSQRGLGMAYAQAGNAAQAVHHYKLYLKASPNAPDRALTQKRIDQLGGR